MEMPGDLKSKVARSGAFGLSLLARIFSRRGQPTLLVALVGLALSILAWVSAAGWQDKIAKAEFDTQASDKLAFLKEGFIDFDDVMRSYAGMIQGAAGMIDRERLGAYAAPLIQKYKGISDLAWIRRVPWNEQPEFEAEARREGLGEYHIFRLTASGRRVAAAGQTEYYPILYLYSTPRDARRAAVGFDLGSDPVRRAILERARDSGELVVASLPLALFRDQGVIAVQAVYAGGVKPGSISERRRTLVGFALGAFRLGQMVDGTLARLTAPVGIHTYLYRNGATATALPVYVHTSLQATIPAVPFRLGVLQAINPGWPCWFPCRNGCGGCGDWVHWPRLPFVWYCAAPQPFIPARPVAGGNATLVSRASFAPRRTSSRPFSITSAKVFSSST
jgi:CHASE1-domain containing sensor protein